MGPPWKISDWKVGPKFFYGFLYMLAACHFIFGKISSLKFFTVTVTLSSILHQDSIMHYILQCREMHFSMYSELQYSCSAITPKLKIVNFCFLMPGAIWVQAIQLPLSRWLHRDRTSTLQIGRIFFKKKKKDLSKLYPNLAYCPNPKT